MAEEENQLLQVSSDFSMYAVSHKPWNRHKVNYQINVKKEASENVAIMSSTIATLLGLWCIPSKDTMEALHLSYGTAWIGKTNPYKVTQQPNWKLTVW